MTLSHGDALPEQQYKTETTRFLHVKMKKEKIIIMGDSHAWGCTIEIADLMGQSYEVTDTVMPGIRNETITSMADKEFSNLNKEDIVIVWSGANDIK